MQQQKLEQTVWCSWWRKNEWERDRDKRESLNCAGCRLSLRSTRFTISIFSRRMESASLSTRKQKGYQTRVTLRVIHVQQNQQTTKKAADLRRIFFLFFYSFCHVFIKANTEWVLSFRSPAIFSKYNNKSEKNCVDRGKGVVGCCTRRDIPANPFTCSSSYGRIPKRAWKRGCERERVSVNGERSSTPWEYAGVENRRRMSFVIQCLFPRCCGSCSKDE